LDRQPRDRRHRQERRRLKIVRHVAVQGRVQGVGFRAFVEHEALKRGLAGWVRNRHDGSVEAVVSGEETIVADMIEACRRGPPGSRVDALHQRDGEAADLEIGGSAEGFTVLPTI
jgi:acylphosphatase